MPINNVRPYSEFIAHNRRPLTALEQREVALDIEPYFIAGIKMIPIATKPGCFISEERAATVSRDISELQAAHNVRYDAERAVEVALARDTLVVYGD